MSLSKQSPKFTPEEKRIFSSMKGLRRNLFQRIELTPAQIILRNLFISSYFSEKVLNGFAKFKAPKDCWDLVKYSRLKWFSNYLFDIGTDLDKNYLARELFSFESNVSDTDFSWLKEEVRNYIKDAILYAPAAEKEAALNKRYEFLQDKYTKSVKDDKVKFNDNEIKELDKLCNTIKTKTFQDKTADKVIFESKKVKITVSFNNLEVGLLDKEVEGDAVYYSKDIDIDSLDLFPAITALKKQ